MKKKKSVKPEWILYTGMFEILWINGEAVEVVINNKHFVSTRKLTNNLLKEQ